MHGLPNLKIFNRYPLKEVFGDPSINRWMWAFRASDWRRATIIYWGGGRGPITKIELVGTIGISCRKLQVLFEEEWLIFQDKNSTWSHKIFSKAKTCLESGGLHFDARLFHKNKLKFTGQKQLLNCKRMQASNAVEHQGQMRLSGTRLQIYSALHFRDYNTGWA